MGVFERARCVCVYVCVCVSEMVLSYGLNEKHDEVQFKAFQWRRSQESIRAAD